MDPHLRAVQEWNKDYLPSETEAYSKSRIEGYIYPQLGPDGKIGILWGDELEAIASHPPSVSLKRYKYYRGRSLDQLKSEFPALVDIIGDNNITYEDLFYYATRGWVPEYDSINMKIDRWNQYEDLSEVSKDLMDRIYRDRTGYIHSNPHPLESTVLAFDMNMEDSSAIKAIASRININIPENGFAHDSFHDQLVDLIDREVPYKDYANTR
jgi:hypothetical protein